ncbi:MAG TPA: GNAT family N-acetyltransferase [Terriglobales bacterium]|nr:GNAT family N-acetyltransferase [Terriglobales bacterium]
MDIHFRRLEASDRTDTFDCGNAQLNEFLHRYALKNQHRMFGVTYVAVQAPGGQPEVIGYFTLANTSIPRQGLPQELLKGLPKYQSMPAFLLGRLAVHKNYQGKRLGEVLLSHCFEHCLAISKLTGARYLIADAKESAVTWYERYNFRKIEGSGTPHSTKMFVDLGVVNTAIKQKPTGSHMGLTRTDSAI